MSHFICAHPDCKTKLRSRNVSGVCKSHTHSTYCQCANCKKHGPAVKQVARKIPDNVRLAAVPATMSSNSTADSPLMAVSLPKEPWDREEVADG